MIKISGPVQDWCRTPRNLLKFCVQIFFPQKQQSAGFSKARRRDSESEEDEEQEQDLEEEEQISDKKRRSNARADERTRRERVRRTDIFTDNVIASLGLGAMLLLRPESRSRLSLGRVEKTFSRACLLATLPACLCGHARLKVFWILCFFPRTRSLR